MPCSNLCVACASSASTASSATCAIQLNCASGTFTGTLSNTTGTHCGPVSSCGVISANGSVCAGCFGGGCCLSGTASFQCIGVGTKADIACGVGTWGGTVNGNQVCGTCFGGGCCTAGTLSLQCIGVGTKADIACGVGTWGGTVAGGQVCGTCFGGGNCLCGTLSVRCLRVGCKATLAATDPPWVLYDPNTREQVAADIERQVEPEKQNGATLFYNKDTKQMEYYVATENKYYKLLSEEITQ